MPLTKEQIISGFSRFHTREAVVKRRITKADHKMERDTNKEYLKRMLAEDDERMKKLDVRFDPITGEGSVGPRITFYTKETGLWYIPEELKTNELIRRLHTYKSIKTYCERFKIVGHEQAVMKALIHLRAKHDFPYYAAQFVSIKAKVGGHNIKFKLNYPQRVLCETFEKLRREGKPINVIVLKARQWGGSTLTQNYMAWIQLMWKQGWYSAIVAHQSSAALKIKAMYDKMIHDFPPSLLELPSRGELRLTPYSGSRTDYTITQGKKQVRDTVISIGSMQSPDSVRAGDVSMVHYSEVGLYRTTDGKTPEDLIQAISASIPDEPLAMNVMESTAKGENNLFHHEWLDAKSGISGRAPVFIPWYFIEMYRRPFENEQERSDFAMSLLLNGQQTEAKNQRSEPGAYLYKLWTMGATLDAINWYVNKRKDFRTHDSMASEFPSDDIEAFAHSGQAIFDKYKVEQLRDECCSPKLLGEVMGAQPMGPGALVDLKFVEDTQGQLKVWQLPDKTFKARNRYVVSVDVGGVTDRADYSVIVVIDRWWRTEGENDEIVAEWYGHCPHEILAWKMLQIASFYNDALLVPEANTFVKDFNQTEGDHAKFILDIIGGQYRNMYTRQASPENIRKGRAREWGFFTSRSSKEMIIDHLKMLINTRGYIEREEGALNEYNTYQRDEKGAANAAQGYHDDRLMARAIGLYVSSTMPMPREGSALTGDNRWEYSATGNNLNESTF